jgi:wyosine [tRNA(Phe)-imidazoG37] synthetase (radical SAM superfamily)
MLMTMPSVYGPVRSWRFGQSLGIDPIGSVSTCSFNCVYCQLGDIQYASTSRRLFVPTEQIRQELKTLPACAVDTITLSGSGEPTLAKNLGDILTIAKQTLQKPVGVLTNGTLLSDPVVCEELRLADWVAVKMDAISADLLRRINRPLPTLSFSELWAGLLQFRQLYPGHLAIQTMLLTPWSTPEQVEYIGWMEALMPDEIQLNTPTRPRAAQPEPAARGNYPICPYPTRPLKSVHPEVLQRFSNRIESALGIPVRYPFNH